MGTIKLQPFILSATAQEPGTFQTASDRKQVAVWRDFWRVHPHAPARAEVVIFNSSQYEDVLATGVHKLIDKTTWAARYERIR